MEVHFNIFLTSISMSHWNHFIFTWKSISFHHVNPFRYLLETHFIVSLKPISLSHGNPFRRLLETHFTSSWKRITLLPGNLLDYLLETHIVVFFLNQCHCLFETHFTVSWKNISLSFVLKCYLYLPLWFLPLARCLSRQWQSIQPQLLSGGTQTESRRSSMPGRPYMPTKIKQHKYSN